MFTLIIKEMRGHARRFVGTAIAVFLGVAFLAGTLVLGDTLRANFDDLFAEVNAGTDVIVRNSTDLGIEADEPRGLIDGGLVDRVAAVDGVEAAEPMWLASTQWLLVGIMVGVWGLYLRLRDVHEGNGKKR